VQAVLADSAIIARAAGRSRTSPGATSSTCSPGRRVLAAKIAALAQLDLDFLVVVNAGSQRQLVAALRRARLRTRVLHLAELVAMAQAASANG
jgi:hypothetical protein